jgi:hypothetical protein
VVRNVTCVIYCGKIYCGKVRGDKSQAVNLQTVIATAIVTQTVVRKDLQDYTSYFRTEDLAMRCDRPFKNLVGGLAAGVFLAVTTVSAAMGQGGPPAGSGMPGNNNPKIEGQERKMSEERLRSAEMNAAVDNKNQQRLEASLAKMKEDFTRIQVVRNQIARSLVARIPIEYGLVSHQTEEINKRANRLKTYMIARASDAKENEQKDLATLGTGDMTRALVQLCKLIDDFVENPALKNAASIDAQRLDKAKSDKVKADRDLLGIIELSNKIQRSADKLLEPSTNP